MFTLKNFLHTLVVPHAYFYDWKPNKPLQNGLMFCVKMTKLLHT